MSSAIHQSALLEILEARKLMSAGVLALAGTSGSINVVTYGSDDFQLIQGPFSITSKGTLLIKGSDNADRITIYAKGTGGSVIFQNRGGSESLIQKFRFTRAQVKRIR